MTERERFEANCEIVADGCWLWTASTDPHGYGQFEAAGTMQRAHRFAYELYVGAIPAGLVLDHLCRNRRCVNPAHLEPVTERENILRGNGICARYSRQTHCKHGHLLDGDNVYPSSRGHRRCKACTRRRNQESYRRRTGQHPEGSLT